MWTDLERLEERIEPGRARRSRWLAEHEEAPLPEASHLSPYGIAFIADSLRKALKHLPDEDIQQFCSCVARLFVQHMHEDLYVWQREGKASSFSSIGGDFDRSYRAKLYTILVHILTGGLPDYCPIFEWIQEIPYQNMPDSDVLMASLWEYYPGE